MKKYIITITLFCLSLILIDDAYALNTKGWGHNINTSSRVYAYDCTSANTCNTSLTVKTLYETDSQNNLVYGVNSYITGVSNDNGGLGFVWAFNVENILKAGYLYNITGYFCNLAGTNIHLNNIVSGNSLSDITGRTHPLTYNGSGAINEISNMPFYDGEGSGKCHYISRFIVPSTNSQYVGMQIGSDNLVTTTWEYYGYTLTELGAYNAVTKDDLNSAIKNSGLASADSVEEVEESVQNVQENINSSIQESTDNINSSIQESTDNINQGIKDGFENCRDSYNLIDYSMINTPTLQSNGYYYLNFPSHKQILNGQFKENTQYTFSFMGYGEVVATNGRFVFHYTDGSTSNCNVLGTTPQYFSCSSSSNKSISYIDITYGSFSKTYLKDLMLNEGSSAKKYEKYGEQICSNRIDETNDKLDNLNDSLTNDSTSGATNSAGSFFEGFTTDTFGLTSIITAPLNLIKSITSKTCTPLNLQIPFVNKNMQLPCMTTIYTNYFGSFLTIYQTITFGIISYWVCIRIFALVKDFKNPDHDEIEVMDL